MTINFSWPPSSLPEPSCPNGGHTGLTWLPIYLLCPCTRHYSLAESRTAHYQSLFAPEKSQEAEKFLPGYPFARLFWGKNEGDEKG